MGKALDEYRQNPFDLGGLGIDLNAEPAEKPSDDEGDAAGIYGALLGHELDKDKEKQSGNSGIGEGAAEIAGHAYQSLTNIPAGPGATIDSGHVGSGTENSFAQSLQRLGSSHFRGRGIEGKGSHY